MIPFQPVAIQSGPRPEVPAFFLPPRKTLGEWFPLWHTASAIIGGAKPPLRFVRTGPNGVGFDFEWLGQLHEICPPEDRETFVLYHDESLAAIMAALEPLNGAVFAALEYKPLDQRAVSRANQLLDTWAVECAQRRMTTPEECVLHILGLPMPGEVFLRG